MLRASRDGSGAAGDPGEGLRRDGAARRVVGRAGDAGALPRHPDRLRELGRVPGEPLRVRWLPLPALLATARRALVPAVAGVPDPPPAGPLPRHLLLLPEGVLPLVLPRPAGVRRR